MLKPTPLEYENPAEYEFLSMRSPGTRARSGSMYRDGMHRDSQWHYHDMHQLLYAFEGGIEVESLRGRNLIPRQLAAWIPAGVPHRASIHGVRWVTVLFPTDQVMDSDQRVRSVMVSALMREMMRESMRWNVDGPECPTRTAFFDAMSRLCSEWITHEANLFLPTISDPRVKRALDYTAQHMELKVEDICKYAGMSVRSLRRHLKAGTGMSWEAYRHRGRLLQAISLLGESEGTIGQIAARCGFESPSAFAKAFKLEMGETPREYRSRVGKAI